MSVENETSLLRVFITSFAISSLAGLARLLRIYPNEKRISIRIYIAAILNSGIFGLIIALLWYHVYKDNLTFLIGISALAGAGGVTLFDFLFLLLKRKIGLKVEFFEKEGENNGND